MTGGQWFDLAVIAIAFVAAVSGWRSGALGSLMSFVGLILGGMAGMLLAPHIINHIDGQRTKLFVALFLVLGLVVVGEVAGVVLGGGVRGAIRNPTLRTVDSVVGVAVQVLVVVVVGWLLASMLANSDQQALAAAVKNSKIRAEVAELVPGWMQAVPTKLSALLKTSGLPDVWPVRPPIIPVDAPDAALATTPVVAATQPSVVKINAVANGCGKELEGSGFVVSANRVMSNAHVVAGADSVKVEAGGNRYDARVVSYDPNADISILDVPGLPAAPLQFDYSTAKTGTDALVLGYPGGGPFVATPARVRELIELNGPDIYGTTTVTRQVYTVRGTVRQGDSGGPLIDLNGRVLGVVFGAAVDDPDTGFVLTANQVKGQLARVASNQQVSTGSCLS